MFKFDNYIRNIEDINTLDQKKTINCVSGLVQTRYSKTTEIINKIL